MLEVINRGQARPALAFYERAAAEAEASKARPDAARAHAAVAWVAVRLAMYQKTIRAGTRALELLKDAGTPAVVTTLWKVDDRASYELVRAFYEELGASDAAAALRQAQRATMQAFPHPFAWAAFGLTGLPR